MANALHWNSSHGWIASIHGSAKIITIIIHISATVPMMVFRHPYFTTLNLVGFLPVL